ncbi:MAG: hypothetical protein Q7S27_01605 [Nanoarchaeota archaeon]|nr:hypothetical protein [Nanoarchaeota archaeon]
MQIIGFNLKKVLAEKSENFQRGPINTNIEFTNVDKENLDMIKDNEALKVSFIFSVQYQDAEKKDDLKHGEVSFNGDILISVSKDESKEITKSWKKKQIPEITRIPVINFILRKCSAKALFLEDELNLPIHIPFPRVEKSAQAPQ